MGAPQNKVQTWLASRMRTADKTTKLKAPFLSCKTCIAAVTQDEKYMFFFSMNYYWRQHSTLWYGFLFCTGRVVQFNDLKRQNCWYVWTIHNLRSTHHTQSLSQMQNFNICCFLQNYFIDWRVKVFPSRFLDMAQIKKLEPKLLDSTWIS